MIIFPRIQRTGGTSFWHGISHAFNDKELWQKGEFARLQYAEIGGLMRAWESGKKFENTPKMFMHHLPFGMHTMFNEGANYITFLREPKSRMISVLNFAASLRYDKKYEDFLIRSNFFKDQLFLQWFMRNSSSVVELLNMCIDNETCCNVMTKQLSGVEKAGNIRSTYAWTAGNIYSINHTTLKYTEQQMQNILEEAKLNIANEFLFVGFQENGTDDHIKACKAVGIKYINHGFRYRGYEDMPDYFKEVDWTDKNILNLLEAMNTYDIELYNFAKEVWGEY